MCGRFTQMLEWRELVALYNIHQGVKIDPTPRPNGAPAQSFVVCRADASGGRELVRLRWGLIPSWARARRIANRLINARSETVHAKPSFRSAFRARRCLIPASSWFEWSRGPGGKRPWLIRRAGGAPLSFAGIWESWRAEGERIETFAILTTTAAAEIADLHHRQPAIVAPVDFGAWLNSKTPQKHLLALTRTPFPGPFEWWRVSRLVNSSANDSPDVLVPAEGSTHSLNAIKMPETEL